MPAGKQGDQKGSFQFILADDDPRYIGQYPLAEFCYLVCINQVDLPLDKHNQFYHFVAAGTTRDKNPRPPYLHSKKGGDSSPPFLPLH